MAARRTFRCRGRDATISRRRKSDVRLAVRPPQLSGVCPRTRGGRQRMDTPCGIRNRESKKRQGRTGYRPGMRCRSTARDTVDARLDPRPAKTAERCRCTTPFGSSSRPVDDPQKTQKNPRTFRCGDFPYRGGLGYFTSSKSTSCTLSALPLDEEDEAPASAAPEADCAPALFC